MTYLGTIMVPAEQVNTRAFISGAASVSSATAAGARNPNLLTLDLSKATLSGGGARLTTNTAGGLNFNLGALTAATGRNAAIRIPLNSLTAASNSAMAANNASVAVRVNSADVRAAAARLSAAQRANSRLSFPNHQVVNSANFTSGIYRGTQFTATNPYVGRYVQTPDGQVSTVMPVGQQFIVLP